jgi:murein L,D-transpeptidase YcbB/YkuD
MAKTKQLTRLQFELSAEKLDEIDRLRREGGFENRKDLLNNAVTLLKWAMKHAEEGHAVAAIDEKSTKYFELQMPFLSHVASNARNRGSVAATERPTIRLGDDGEYVAALQSILAAKGFAVPTDGHFNVATATAVREFQESRGLPADGIVGPRTWQALGS